MLYDNLSAVYLSENPALHKRLKHFDTNYHYIREQVALGIVETRHIPAALRLQASLPSPYLAEPSLTCDTNLELENPYLKFEGEWEIKYTSGPRDLYIKSGPRHNIILGS